MYDQLETFMCDSLYNLILEGGEASGNAGDDFLKLK